MLAITGASGVGLAEKFINYLPQNSEAIDLHIVISKHAKTVAKYENETIHNVTLHNNEDIAASIASGSFQVDATVVLPCSMNTLAKIACGIADNLTSRVAAVAIKEQKRLLLAPREMPLSAIALENMLKLSKLGVVIAPPIIGYYSESNSLEDIEKFIIGKWYDTLGIEHNLYKRWS